jgi:hypothetical protein
LAQQLILANLASSPCGETALAAFFLASEGLCRTRAWRLAILVVWQCLGIAGLNPLLIPTLCDPMLLDFLSLIFFLSTNNIAKMLMQWKEHHYHHGEISSQAILSGRAGDMASFHVNGPLLPA